MRKIVAVVLLAVLLESCAAAPKTVQTSDDVSAAPQIESAGEPQLRVYLPGRRRHGGGVRAIPMETYLAGVIGNEMSRRWPPEALKAQAVAARSYALYRMNEARKEGRRFDVVTTQADQVFRACDMKNDYLCSVVAKTRGEVLMKNGKIVEAFYSSTCGGKSESAAGANLSDESPLLGCKTDNYCLKSPFRHWVVNVTLYDIEKRLNRSGLRIHGLKSISVGSKNVSGYARTINYRDAKGAHHMSAASFRQMMGNMRVKSLLFNIHTGKEGNVSISGNGFGHGVGMCQYGAKEMASHRAGYKRILGKYYPGVGVVKMY